MCSAPGKHGHGGTSFIGVDSTRRVLSHLGVETTALGRCLGATVDLASLGCRPRAVAIGREIVKRVVVPTNSHDLDAPLASNLDTLRDDLTRAQLIVAIIT